MTPSSEPGRPLLAEAAFVRALAARLVADEADDVVQQTWVRALESRPQSVADPRRWLASIVRNLVTDRVRARQRSAQRERRAAAHERVPSTLELVAIEEQRRRLVDAVNALPESQRAIVLLRYYEGLPPRRIARDLGLSVTAVSNRLHAALRRLRERLDGEHGGDRRAWLLPLVPFAAAPRLLPPVAATSTATAAAGAVGGVLTGAIAMTTKTKIMAAVAGAFLLALVLTWQAFAAGPEDVPARPDEPHSPVVATAPADERPAPIGVAEDPARRAAVEAPVADALATSGSLVVHVRYADAPEAAIGMEITLRRAVGHFRFGLLRAVTDEHGDARFDGVPPGRVVVRPPRTDGFARADVVAGEVVDCSLRLSEGQNIDGIVVDDRGAPIAGAVIEMGQGALARWDACVVARTAADGTFRVRHGSAHCVVGARAEGFAASALSYVGGEPGETRAVRIVLKQPGGVVTGQVVGPDQQPIAGAVVIVGPGVRTGLRTGPMGGPPLPEQVVTLGDGRFRAIGVPTGEQPIRVSDGVHAPWSGTCEVVASSAVAVQVALTPGARCEGIARGDDGAPLPGVEVVLGGTDDWLEQVTRSDDRGAFVLGGLAPAVPHALKARHGERGEGGLTIQGAPGETVHCEITVARGLELRGRVVDEADAPLARVLVEKRQMLASGQKHWFGSIFTDADGRFAIANCEPGVLVDLKFTAADRLPVVREGVDPRAGELVVAIAADTRPKAIVRGRLRALDGGVPTGAEVRLSCREAQDRYPKLAADGAFSIEVAPGEWNLHVACEGHPTIRRDDHVLGSGEVWDLGLLQLTVGGAVVVHATGVDGAYYTVCDPDGAGVCAIYNPDPPPRSELLAPGDYVLRVGGKGIATALVPFSVRAGETTEVTTQVAAGVRQVLRFDGGGAAGTTGTRLDILQAGERCAWAYANADRRDAEVFLRPGDYAVRVRGSSRAPVAFTVGEQEGAPVVVDLR